MGTVKKVDKTFIRKNKIKAIFLLLLVLFFVCSCGAGGGGSLSSSPATSNAGGGGGGSATGSIAVTATPSSLTVLGTASIQATVHDSNGANVADGKSVAFSINSSDFGAVTAQATTLQGVAVATFTAANRPGTAVITATADNVTANVSIPISAAA